MFDTAPDWEFPKTPEGFEYVEMRIPQPGDYCIDYYGKPYLITEAKSKYFVESHPVFRKI